MLFIVCGEDSAASRNYFLDLQDQYKKKGCYLQPADAASIADILKEEQGTVSLFTEPKVYAVTNLTRYINRKTASSLGLALEQAAANPNITLLDWEADKPKRAIPFKDAKIKEFKLPQSIFDLLEACRPGNYLRFTALLKELCRHMEPEFVFAMLSRHTRQLMLAKENGLPKNIMAWQRAKINAQTGAWNEKVLLQFYEGLARIDFNTKTGRDALGVQKAIDILAAFCLR